MVFKAEIRKPILALLLLSVGGWLFHVRIHTIEENSSNLVPFLFGLISFLFVPAMLNYKKTVIVGYLLNGFSVIIGTVLMTHYSLADLPQPLTFTGLLFRTTLADIFILLPKLMIGYIILLHYFPGGLGRMFTSLWWVKHFCYFAVVYTLGHLLLG